MKAKLISLLTLLLALTLCAACALAATANATVVAPETVKLTAPFAGTLKAFDLTAGDAVAAGDTLFEIDTTPVYAAQSGTVAAGEMLAVTRVQGKYTFETELAAAAAAVKVGTKIQVASGGLKAKYVTGGSSSAAPGTFEVVSLEGTEAGSMIRGRFV